MMVERESVTPREQPGDRPPLGIGRVVAAGRLARVS
jgi:hypothetical protein